VEIKPHPSFQQPLKSAYVSSKHAVAGLGMLSDHGLRDHGKTSWPESTSRAIHLVLLSRE
jgi:hypothetical protein